MTLEPPERITAVIADDHPIVRQALRLALERRVGLTVSGEAANGLEAISATKRLQPALLLLDQAMPHAHGLDIVSEVKRWSPDTRIVVLTGLTGHGLLAALVDAGVEGLILKSESEDELVETVRRVLRGKRYLSAEVQRLLETRPTLNVLTLRELQILTRIANGESNVAIAGWLGISPKTVDNHRTNIMRKLNMHSAAELISFAVREGVLDTARHL